MKSYPHNSQLILASQSYARQQLLKEAGVIFTTCVADIDEKKLRTAHSELSIKETALFLACEKACNVSTKYPHFLVIGADQTLDCEGILFEKPETLEDVKRDIARLQGKEQILYTAVAAAYNGSIFWKCEKESHLWMKKMDLEEQGTYIHEKGKDVIGCLGCFQIEKSLDLFSRIDGEIAAIQGLPMKELIAFLKREGIKVL